MPRRHVKVSNGFITSCFKFGRLRELDGLQVKRRDHARVAVI